MPQKRNNRYQKFLAGLKEKKWPTMENSAKWRYFDKIVRILHCAQNFRSCDQFQTDTLIENCLGPCHKKKTIAAKSLWQVLKKKFFSTKLCEFCTVHKIFELVTSFKQIPLLKIV